MVPRSVNLTGKRDNAGHEKTTVNKLVIYGQEDRWSCLYFALHKHDYVRGLSQKFVDFIHNSNYFLVRDKIVTLLITLIVPECYGKIS